MTEPNNETIAVTPMADVLAEFLPELNVLREEPQTKASATDEEAKAKAGAAETGVQQGEEQGGEVETETDPDPDAGPEEIADGEGAGEEDDKVTEQHRNAWPESARKRVDKLTAKLREAEQRESARAAELEELQKQLAAGSKQEETQPRQATKEDGLLSSVWNEADLVTEANKALNWKQWALQNPDGGTVKVGDKEQEYDAEAVQRIIVNTDRILNVEIPKRRQFLQNASQIEGQLSGLFPEYFDPARDEHKAAIGAISEFPELKRRADGMAAAIALSIGLRTMAELRKQRSDSKTKPTEKKPAAPKVPVAPKPTELSGMPGTVAGSTKPKRSREQAVESVVARAGDIDALAEYFTQ